MTIRTSADGLSTILQVQGVDKLTINADKSLVDADGKKIITDATRGRVLIASGTANNSASVVFTWNPAGFNHYELIWDAVLPQISSILFLNFSVDSGASYVAGQNFLAQTIIASNGSAPTGGGNTADAAYRIGGGFNVPVSAAGQGTSGLFKTLTNNFQHSLSEQLFDTGVISLASGAHFNTLGGVANAVKLSFQTGLITSGTFRLYGIR